MSAQPVALALLNANIMIIHITIVLN